MMPLVDYEAAFASREVDLIDDPLGKVPAGTTIWKQTLVFGGSDAEVTPERCAIGVSLRARCSPSVSETGGTLRSTAPP